MTILNDGKIRQYINDKKIIITPTPDGIQFQPASVDLRLDDNYLTFNTTTTPVIDTRREQYYTEYHTFTDNNPLVLQPKQFILAQTLERVNLPDDVLGRVEGRSSLGRIGVVIHITAGFIDPAFEGNITLEIVNLGNIPVVLYPKQRVCQIVFEELDGKCERPYGTGNINKYQGQSSPTPSGIYMDK